jgi:anti-sigma-K factor RskA
MNPNEHDSRLEEAAAYALGALDADRLDDFKAHLEGCERCQDEVRWLAPAVDALPEAVAQQAPPPALRERLMTEVRADAAAHAKQAKREERRERAEARSGFGEWLRGLHVGGLTWKPLAGMAAVILVVAAGIGYAVGTGGGSNIHTTESREGNGIVAKVVTEDGRAEVRLTGVAELPKGRVLEAWIKHGGESVEPVPALFAPDKAGDASTTIDDADGVTEVLVTREPAGGSKQPTTTPIVAVPLES